MDDDDDVDNAEREFAAQLADALGRFAEGIVAYRTKLTAGAIAESRARLLSTVSGLILGDAVTSCAEDFERVKLWTSSLNADDPHRAAAIATVKIGEALISGGHCINNKLKLKASDFEFN